MSSVSENDAREADCSNREPLHYCWCCDDDISGLDTDADECGLHICPDCARELLTTSNPAKDGQQPERLMLDLLKRPSSFGPTYGEIIFIAVLVVVAFWIGTKL